MWVTIVLKMAPGKCLAPAVWTGIVETELLDNGERRAQYAAHEGLLV